MTRQETPSGFGEVDRSAFRGEMVAMMDATGRWPAVQELRAWERGRLRLRPGDSLLDVGCGTAEVLRGLALDVPLGRAVGVDASAVMLEEGRRRAEQAGAALELRQGDATALELPDAAFDACRSERTLQWVADPSAVIAELVRVLEPGGRLVVTDTDWSTLVMDHPDRELARRVLDGLSAVRGQGAQVGGRLANLVRDAGAQHVEVTAATHTWSHWDPDRSPNPPGFPPPQVLIEQLDGVLDASATQRFLDGWVRAARADRYFMAVTMFAVAGVAP